ncbi:MAG: 50S ribosomal protein L32 [Gemmatimonadetes bacterium]|nr:50S ribosomal protein L32 [Gemmatimonadota bacterium]
MNTPKRRHSKSRRDKRRANWRMIKTDLSICSNCGAHSLPHRVCPSCGHYAGREVVPLETE